MSSCQRDASCSRPQPSQLAANHEALLEIASLIATFDNVVNPHNRHPVIRGIDEVLKKTGYRGDTDARLQDLS